MPLALAALVHAESALTGKWQGQTPNGAELVLDLTATGTALTGTLTRNGQPATVTDGKVSKNTFTFKATMNDQTEGFTGEFARDEMRLWLDRQGREKAAVLKRVGATGRRSVDIGVSEASRAPSDDRP
jgi:hypothetical protein